MKSSDNRSKSSPRSQADLSDQSFNDADDDSVGQEYSMHISNDKILQNSSTSEHMQYLNKTNINAGGRTSGGASPLPIASNTHESRLIRKSPTAIESYGMSRKL